MTKPDFTENRYAVCVGINNYKPETGLADLKYAEKDASAVYEMLGVLGFAPENRKLLLGEDATLSAINQALAEMILDKPKRNDLIVFYFAGHSIPVTINDPDDSDIVGKSFNINERRSEVFLANWDFDHLHVKKSRSFRLNEALGMERLRQNFFEATLSNKVLFIFDSCYSGDFYGPRYRDDNMASNQVHNYIAKMLESKSSGRLALSSCLSIQKATEDDSLEHGRFTYYLIEALGGRAKEALRRDGWLTVGSLFEYLARKLPEEQRPVLSGVQQDTFELVCYSQLFLENREGNSSITVKQEEFEAVYLENLRQFLLQKAGVDTREQIISLVGSVSNQNNLTTNQLKNSFTNSELILETLLQTENHIAVLGVPGSGKTTMLCAIGLDAIDNYLTGKSKRLPLFVRLSHFKLNVNIEDYLQSELCFFSDPSSPLVTNFKKNLLKSERWLILLDGINELADRKVPNNSKHNSSRKLAKTLLATSLSRLDSIDVRERELVQLGNEYRQLKIVVSCREYDYSHIPSWCEFRIKAMNDQQIEQFVINYLGNVRGPQLAKRLRQNKRTLELMRNPFYLKAMITVYNPNSPKLPTTRGELMKMLSSSLLVKEFNGVNEENFVHQELVRKLSLASYELITQQIFSPTFPVVALRQYMSDQEIQQAIDTGFFIEQRTDGVLQLRFYHQVLQEFLAACHFAFLFDQYQRGNTSRKKLRRELQKRMGTVTWRLALQFAVSMVNNQKAFLEELLLGRNGIVDTVYSELVRADTVNYCLEEADKLAIEDKQKFIKYINDLVNRPLLSNPIIVKGYQLIRKASIAPLVSSFELLIFSKMEQSRRELVRATAARCLGWLRGSEKALDKLLEMAEHPTPETAWPIVVGISELQNPRALDYLLYELENGDLSNSWQAGIGLALLRDNRAVSRLTSFLNHSDESRRWIAIYALGEIAAIEVLEKLKSHPDRNRNDGLWSRYGKNGKNVVIISTERIEAKLNNQEDPYPDFKLQPGFSF